MALKGFVIVDGRLLIEYQRENIKTRARKPKRAFFDGL